MGVGRPNTPTRQKTTITGPLTFTITSTGVSSDTYDLGGAHRFFTIQNAKLVKGSGGPTALAFRLQGSLNGTDWHNLMAAASATTSASMVNTTASHAVTKIRVNSTGKTGGTGGTSTVILSVGIPGE